METREAEAAGEGSRLNEAGEGFFIVGKDALTRSTSEDVDLWTWLAEIEFSFSFCRHIAIHESSRSL
jgi:hypothetical protein